MADIVITGGGMIGLASAMLLADDGHAVTVLERDPAPPPDPGQAWASWERQGVNQFRLLHQLLPRSRAVIEAELPRVAKALEAAGCRRFNPVQDMPEELRGPIRDDDDRFEFLTGRRPVAEAVVAGCAAETDGVTVRRGVAVTGLVADGPGNVVGVQTAGGEIRAEVVIDAGGRRSAAPQWIEAIGGRRPAEEVDDSGFVYFGRHFHGDMPFALGPALQPYGSISTLTLAADNDTWGIGVIASSKDPAIRGLRDAERWTRVVRSLPLTAHWLEGEPIDDVAVMAKIEDRHRSFVVDGTPVVTGVLPVGDAWACTNPSVGRGISIGLMHALALRDLLRQDLRGADQAVAWHEATLQTVEPYYRATLSFDRLRLAEMQALIDGTELPAGDEYEITNALGHAAFQDPDCLRAYLQIVTVLATAADVLPAVFDKVVALGAGWRDAPALGPSREELLALAG